jgi:tRNA threonylcarbamoyladenosine biosynthesis protein TsaB
MATAKGLCYALEIPLMAISTTEAMCSRFLSVHKPAGEDLLLPMVDARRMEVFTRIFDAGGNPVSEPRNYISGDGGLIPETFSATLHLFGSGAAKMEEGFAPLSVRIYPESFIHAEFLLPLAMSRFTDRRFDPLAYTVPFYGKEWQGG